MDSYLVLPFVVLAGSAVVNEGSTVLHGDLGLCPGTAVVGFPPGIIHKSGDVNVGSLVACQAQANLALSFVDPIVMNFSLFISAQLDGTTLLPGVYSSKDSFFRLGRDGILTLDGNGDSNSVFRFVATSWFTTECNSVVRLINGARSDHVEWWIGSSATLGCQSIFKGRIIARQSITAITGANIEGQLWALNGAVHLNENVITRPSSE